MGHRDLRCVDPMRDARRLHCLRVVWYYHHELGRDTALRLHGRIEMTKRDAYLLAAEALDQQAKARKFDGRAAASEGNVGEASTEFTCAAGYRESARWLREQAGSQ